MIYKWTILDANRVNNTEYLILKQGQSYRTYSGICYKDGKEFLEEMEISSKTSLTEITSHNKIWKYNKASKEEIKFYNTCIKLDKI